MNHPPHPTPSADELRRFAVQALYGKTAEVAAFLNKYSDSYANIRLADTPLLSRILMFYSEKDDGFDSRCFKDTLNLLIARGADINAVDDHGCPVLFAAIGSNYPEAVPFLIENGANLFVRASNTTPEEYAASYDRPDLVALIEQKKKETLDKKFSRPPCLKNSVPSPKPFKFKG